MGTESVAENGDRIIRGSMRPDGSYRKDRRVRAGYVPQDEQPVYESKEALARRGYQRCPGLDEPDGSKAVPKSKTAKKNERRKQSKVDTKEDILLADDSTPSNLVEDVANLRLDPDTTTEAQGSLSNTEKKIRTIRKKLQQAEALSVRQAAGEKLTQPELEKLSKTTVWRQELQTLEDSCKG